jgi:glycosyltransferase involved in cell wall biosynthesis
MKIYIDGIIYSLQKVGGVARYTDELIDGLLRSGYEVTLILHPYPLYHPLTHEKLEIISIKPFIKINKKIFTIINRIYTKFWIEHYFIKNKISKGAFHNTYLTSYNYLKIPQVITIHDMTLEEFPDSFNSFHKIKSKLIHKLIQQAINKTDSIICYSQQTKNDLLKYHKITNKEKINVIYLGVSSLFKRHLDVDKESFRKLNNLTKPYFFYIGTRLPYKNFNKLLKAFSVWKEKDNFSLVVAGGNEFNNKEIAYIENLGLTKNVVKSKLSKEEDIVMLYNCAHALVFPSTSEGFGLPLVESMACGTPLLISDIPIFREITHDIPYYFNPHDTSSITSMLSECLVIDENRINAGIKRAQNFNWESMVNQTIEIYKKLEHKNI